MHLGTVWGFNNATKSAAILSAVLRKILEITLFSELPMLFLFFVFSQSASSPPVDAVPVAELPEEAIDEITVVAPRTALSIRAEIIEVEEKMFDIFNSLNTDRDFHVVCGWGDRDTGNPSTISRLKQWKCVSNYERHILSSEFHGVSGVNAISDAASAMTLTQGPIRRHREEFRQKIIELAEENPELTEAIYRRARLEQDYAAARKSKED